MDGREDDGTASATHLASPFSSSSSTSSRSCDDGGREDEAEVFIEQKRPTEEREEDEEEGDRDEDGGDGESGTDGDDDGYCTPTSPQHMIPPNKDCPPAPKRDQWFPNLKRKAEVAGGLSRSAVQPVRVLDVSLELDGFLQRSKKARREASIAK